MAAAQSWRILALLFSRLATGAFDEADVDEETPRAAIPARRVTHAGDQAGDVRSKHLSEWGGNIGKPVHQVSPDLATTTWGSEAPGHEGPRGARKVFEAGMSDSSSEASSDGEDGGRRDGATDEDELTDTYWEPHATRDVPLAEACSRRPMTGLLLYLRPHRSKRNFVTPPFIV